MSLLIRIKNLFMYFHDKKQITLTKDFIELFNFFIKINLIYISLCDINYDATKDKMSIFMLINFRKLS